MVCALAGLETPNRAVAVNVTATAHRRIFIQFSLSVSWYFDARTLGLDECYRLGRGVLLDIDDVCPRDEDLRLLGDVVHDPELCW
jgi:hypothetical protein